MILIRGNANAKQWNEGEERRFWVKDIRTRGKREAVGQKKEKKHQNFRCLKTLINISRKKISQIKIVE